MRGDLYFHLVLSACAVPEQYYYAKVVTGDSLAYAKYREEMLRSGSRVNIVYNIFSGNSRKQHPNRLEDTGEIVFVEVKKSPYLME